MTQNIISEEAHQRAIDRRQMFHQYPEPSWCEFHTTSQLVDSVEAIGVDEVIVGRKALRSDKRLGVPDKDVLNQWTSKARAEGARADVLEATSGGHTGLLAVLDRGPGPVVGLRVDIDALPFEEADESAHTPAAAGFRSRNSGVMHACGHDAHMSIGLGVLETLADEEFDGTLKLFFQPAEEVLGGGRPMAATEHVDDIDQFFALHIGLGHPTGTVVAGSQRPLAVRQSTATFSGESAHAGLAPQSGRNAMQAMATAITNLYGISRHADGLTRVNVGHAEAGSASNIIADAATVQLEVRAGANNVLEHMISEADRVLLSAAEMHDCQLSTTVTGRAPRVDSDQSLRDVVTQAADKVDAVESIVPQADFGASEDATYFMQQVADSGGNATFVIIGTDHPAGHHTPRFDVDERSLAIGIDVVSRAIRIALADEGGHEDGADDSRD